MRELIALMLTLALPALADDKEPPVGQSHEPETFKCPVTIVDGGKSTLYQDEFLEVTLPPKGTFIAPPYKYAVKTRDGAWAMKIGWHRFVKGRLTITGRRLDSPGPPLRADISDGYGDIGFQPMYLIFPTPGCWEVTGHLNDKTLTVVLLAVKENEQPPRPDDTWWPEAK